MLISLLFEQPMLFFVWVLAVIYAITIHEFSHVLSANLQGDNTGQSMGRLSLNPLVHLDWLGLVLLMVVGFGWGKPAPFNPYNLKYKKWGPALVAVAGPLSNIISIVVFGIALKLILMFTSLESENLLIAFLVSLIQINLILALFNMLPIPPLDGSKILFTFLPQQFSHIAEFLERYGMWLLLAFIIFGSSLLFAVFNVLYNLVMQILVI